MTRSSENQISRTRCAAFALAAAGALGTAHSAAGQLREDQVLVVYDSRLGDSLLVAEHYAGSSKVPGGTGGRPGTRPGVHVVNLASLPGAGFAAPVSDITHPVFRSSLRDPLRTHLNAGSLAGQIRCIVLTKGLPHRIQDTDVPTAGDFPGTAAAEFNSGDYTAASVDSELTLLQQNTHQTENGNPGDSRLDGVIVNPYHRSPHPIGAYSTEFITNFKSFSNQVAPNGVIWQSTIANLPFKFTPGDMYLVCRLDGPTVQVVRDMLDRAASFVYDTGAVAFVLDESGGNGTISSDFPGDGEIDNDVGIPAMDSGDDYEQTRDALLTDGRFIASGVRYDHLAGAPNFSLGPLVDFGGSLIISQNVVLLAHYGSNHNGIPGGGNGGAFYQYATSFNYAPGAIFNTAESFNGRDYGGLGQGPVTQQQSASFLASGGTFAIGNVYEPFSFTLADNEFLVRNFVLGGLSWAEAAYTALPGISWQQIVVGDPLARARRSGEDRNGDGVLNLEDLYAFTAAPSDLNRSGGAPDAADFALMRAAVRGPENGVMVRGRR